MKYIATVEGQTFEVEINSEREVTVNGTRLSVDFEPSGDQPVFTLLLDGKSYEAYVYPTETGMQVLLRGHLYQVTVEDERQRRLRESSRTVAVSGGEFHLKSPMPGLIVSVPVEEGQAVEQGQDLVILESMKMQNELKAPRRGTVGRIRVRPGDSVEQNALLLTLA
jgi:biotin carboxyl carrier protein